MYALSNVAASASAFSSTYIMAILAATTVFPPSWWSWTGKKGMRDSMHF
jgi:hypothetical protein